MNEEWTPEQKTEVRTYRMRGYILIALSFAVSGVVYVLAKGSVEKELAGTAALVSYFVTLIGGHKLFMRDKPEVLQRPPRTSGE